MVKRTQDEAAETRERLLGEAHRLFAAQGFAGTRIEDIARASNTTKGAIFHHFKSKEHLFVEVWTRLQVEMDAEANAAAVAGRSKNDPYAAFLAGCRVYFDWATRTDYQRIVLIDGPSVMGMGEWHDRDFALGLSSVGRGTAYLARQGSFPETLARPAAILLQAALNGAGFALTANKPFATRDELFGTFERLLRGLK